MEPTEPQLKAANLTLQQRVLGRGMLSGNENSTLDYAIQGGDRVHAVSFGGEDFLQLAAKIENDPKEVFAFGRLNLFGIMNDPNLPVEERPSRTKRYVDAYLDLLVKLDQAAFSPTPGDEVMSGVPSYVMDGLSDLGSDGNTVDRLRSREKIRVDKKELFEKSKDLFYNIFTYDIPKNRTQDQIKKWIIKNVGAHVSRNMPYDFDDKGIQEWGGRSIGLHESIEKKLAQCRHQALASQVLLQAMGIESRLVKSDVDYGDGKGFGPHVNNIVRVEGRWYLFDSTAPERDNNNEWKDCMWPIPDENIDLASNRYVWEIQVGDRKRTYKSRNNMYWRIRDNATS